MARTNVPDTALLKEAADWAMRLRYDAPTDSERLAFDRWRRQSPAHDAAWARAQAVFHTFEQVPVDIGKEALESLGRGRSRRRSLRLLGALLLAPAAWTVLRHAPWREWAADAATATGERRVLALPDGSRLVLNTASAVNIVFSAAERRIRLVAGEILVTTHADPARRPFVVDTAEGAVRALGTRFSVRRMDRGLCRVAVFEHAVEVRTLSGASAVLREGEGADFDASGVGGTVSVDAAAALWEKGMLLAKDMPLGEVVAELARHRPGVLRCDPAVADLLVSGAISLDDTEAGLAALSGSLPVRVERRTRYWVTVAPKNIDVG